MHGSLRYAGAIAAAALAAAVFRPVCSAAGTNDLVCFEGPVREAGITSIEAVPGGLLLAGPSRSIRLALGSRQLESAGATVWLHAAPVIPYNATSGWQVVKEDLESVILPILAPTNGAPAKLRVVLDAGHGGEDGGAASYDGALVQEKSFTLAMARRIGALLDEAGMEVVYTRVDDITLQLRERTDIAAATNADVFVSIHANTAANPSAAGFETYVLPCAGQPATGYSTISPKTRAGNDNDFLNNLLAFQVHRRLPGRKRGYDRGVRRARYQVLRDAQCPAILIECGFLSNTGDVRRLSSNWYRDLFAKAVCDGILDYASRVPPPAAAPDEDESK